MLKPKVQSFEIPYYSYTNRLFNSKLLSYLYKLNTEEIGRTFAQVKTVNVKKLPFKNATQKAQTIFIEKLSKKLATFYNFDFKTYVAELKKKKVTLSLIQQDEWEDYFNAYKTEINQLQQKITKTDTLWFMNCMI